MKVAILLKLQTLHALNTPNNHQSQGVGQLGTHKVLKVDARHLALPCVPYTFRGSGFGVVKLDQKPEP